MPCFGIKAKECSLMPYPSRSTTSRQPFYIVSPAPVSQKCSYHESTIISSCLIHSSVSSPVLTPMAHTTTFLCQNTPGIFHSNQVALMHVRSPPLGRLGIKQTAMQVKKCRISQPKNSNGYILQHQRDNCLFLTSAAESDSVSAPSPLSDVIRKFYTCINDKDSKQLEDLISTDCFLEDSTFPHSFHEKEEVMKFIRELVESMGDNVHFRIGTVCEGEALVASIDWHLEWKEDQIPFSRGCTFFQCTEEEGILVIRKAQIITESPIKPGKLALGMLKMLASLFDEFPKAAKWFLKSPQTIFTVVLHIYNLTLAPIMNPVLAFYITLWKLIVRLLGYIISFLHIVVKMFYKKSTDDQD